MELKGWAYRKVGSPLEMTAKTVDKLEPGEALIEVRACGVCHTDLGFVYDGVPVRGGAPIILGHEIAGVVIDAAGDAAHWIGRAVVVPAVLPCGACDACRRGRSGICPTQRFLGNDIDGGFATHVRVPAPFLCEVSGLDASRLAELAVVADAVTTPLNAIEQSGLDAGDVAVFIGIGGIGVFGAQIAKARGAHVVAIDVDDARLESVAGRWADHVMNTAGVAPSDVKKRLRAVAKEHGWPTTEWKIFETSGTVPGQDTAFSLLNHGATLMVVGYTAKKVELRLSNLMAFEATAQGVWGCPPALYPKAIDYVRSGAVVIEPFIERHPLADVNQVLERIHRGEIKKRVVLIPDNKGA